MSLSSERETMRAGLHGASGGAPGVPTSAAQAAEPVSSDASAFDDLARARLAEKLNVIAESADPVAELDSAIGAVADELGKLHPLNEEHPIIPEQHGEIEGAIETLINVALDMDDPVRGLEEGADSLAGALAARDAAARSQLRAAHERDLDEQAAYRHARFHRVAELIDTGYSLDQAVSITNANEAEIRARAVAIGRDPMEPIYQYAVLNGYRSSAPAPSASMSGSRSSVAPGRPTGDDAQAIEALARLSDEAFAEATQGDRWQKLMQR